MTRPPAVKKGFMTTLLLFARLCLAAADSPEITLSAGWSWLTYWDGIYPYGRHAPDYWPYAGAGVGVPLYPPVDGRSPFYGYYGDPWRGFGYGVSYRLTESRYADPVPSDMRRPLPGSAPLKLRDPAQERAWGQEISELMKVWDTEAWMNSATNRPVAD